MAVEQHAWMIDHRQFHQWLGEELQFVENPVALRRLAMAAARSTESGAIEYLSLLRVDPTDEEAWNECFDDAETFMHDHVWYQILMATYLLPVSAPGGWGWWHLERELQSHGWSTDDALVLAYGERLDELVRYSNAEWLGARVYRPLANVRGWLSPERAFRLQQQVDDTARVVPPGPLASALGAASEWLDLAVEAAPLCLRIIVE